MKDKGESEQAVLERLSGYRARDISYDRVLSAMCTSPHPIATRAHVMFMEANLGDAGLFPGTHEMEHEVIAMLGGMLGDAEVHGYITTGGTESNIQAIRAARNSGISDKPNIVVSESAHFSFDKIADLLRVEVRKADLDDVFRVDPASVEAHIDDNTVAIVGIAGTTEFGQVDPIRELSDMAVERSIFLHVDAAFGAFVIPFLDKRYDFDFRLPGVSSMTSDPHKMGLCTIPAGGLLFRDPSHLHELHTHTPYLTIDTQYSLSGTRSGAVVAAAYAVMRHLGLDGYRTTVEHCMKLTRRVVERAGEFGVEPLIDPVMNVVVLDVGDTVKVRKAMVARGWYTSITRRPLALRLVIMPHMSEKRLEEFLDDLEQVFRELT
ncbi:MAG: tyrosine decarboxylase MfnA [ANME-2 cluster archaeon]|nr:tyrosine decarboxylase MfnA [ANME-2 cluster archaeon]